MVPPGSYLTIRSKTLQLSEPVGRGSLRLPIDFFFRSLAAEQQQRAIAMILSGCGSDGAMGLREIKARGGVVMVQDPQSAQYDGMPRAGLRPGWLITC